MQALILAGGKGTRLRPLTVYTPKPIVPLVNRAFLLYQIDVLQRAGITDITLSLSYQPDKIEHVLGNGSEFGVSIRYISEPSPMGTAGAYKFAMNGTREPTIVFNGDILTSLRLSDLIDVHTKKGAAATLTLARVAEPGRYGVAVLGDEGRIEKFIEKPIGEVPSNTVNAGIYVLEPSILDHIPEGTNHSFEYDVFPSLLSGDARIFGHVLSDEYWLDIGTPASYLEAHHDYLAGRVAGLEIVRNTVYEAATRSNIDRLSVIGEECTIKSGVTILNSVIGPGVHIEEKALIENSVVWAHTRIASAAEIRDSIIGRSCHIGRNAVVGPGSVLGDKTTLTDYTRV